MIIVLKNKTYDFGFALYENCESHSAANFLSIAILKMIENDSFTKKNYLYICHNPHLNNINTIGKS